MKRVFFTLMVALALVACGSKTTSENGQEMGQTSEGVSIEKKVLAGERIYDIGGSYSTYKYSIEVPEKVAGIDAEKFKQFVIDAAFDTIASTDIQAAIDADADEFGKQFEGKLTTAVNSAQVDKMRETNESMEHQYPVTEIKVKIGDYDAARRVIPVNVEYYMDYDSGTGAGVSYRNSDVLYDCERNARIVLDDIVADKAALLAKVKEQLTYRPDDDCIFEDEVKKLEELPSNFVVGPLSLTFIFSKYAVACGSAGNIEQEMSLDVIKDMLTPLGKRLFLGDASDEKTSQEVKARMEELITKCLNYKDDNYDFDGIKAYQTKHYLDLFKKCDATAEEPGFWLDYDPYIDAQDYENVSFTVNKVNVLSPDRAIVEVTVKNFESVTPKYFMWVREDGKFMLDDFTTSGVTMVKMMNDIIAMHE